MTLGLDLAVQVVQSRSQCRHHPCPLIGYAARQRYALARSVGKYALGRSKLLRWRLGGCVHVQDHPSSVRTSTDDTAKSRTARAVVISVVLCGLVAAVDIWIGWTDLALTDEGYLWYGTQRVLDGEWPVKDFYSYDPGRYIWSAAWLFLFGDSILALRIASWIFAAVGLTCGLLVAERVVRSTKGLVTVAILLIAWMVPRHKRIDCVLPLAAILAAVSLIERRDTRSHIRAGIVAGVIAFFGRNHGFYAIVGLIAVTWFVAPPQRLAFVKRLGSLLAGAAMGYLPMLLLWAVYPSFLPAFLRLSSQIAGNRGPLGKGFPWPWLASTPRGFVIGMIFVAVPIVYVVVAAQLLRRRRSLEMPYDSVCLAATAIGIPYVHHALVQPGSLHLAQASAPFVLLAVTLVAKSWRHAFVQRRALAAAGAALLLVSTAFTVLPIWEPYRVLRNPQSFGRMEVDGVTLVVKNSMRRRLRLFQRFEAAVGEDQVLVAPRWPAVYAMLDKRAPTYHDYMMWSAGPEGDRKLIDDLDAADVRWVMINDTGPADHTFEALYPQTMDHIRTAFEEIEFKGQPSDVHVFWRDPW